MLYNKGMKNINESEKNGMWKGNKVGYTALHNWIKRRLLKPEKCQNCHIETARDLANISNEYKRDLSDWWWLCRRCHMKIDGRIENLEGKHRKTGWWHKCNYCKKEHWVTPCKEKYGEGKHCSKSCSNKANGLPRLKGKQIWDKIRNKD